MNLISKSLLSFLAIIFVVSCSNSMDDADVQQTVYFNQFIPCKAGPDYSAETMKDFVAEWNELVAVYDEMVWAGGYAPASGQQNGWWELQWTSKEAADAAWAEWESNEAAAAWTEKHAGVMQCDGPGRFKFDGIFPIEFETYGEKNPSGYFYSEFYGCKYKEGSGREDAEAFVEGFNNAVAEADYSETGYHYGNYFAHDTSTVNPEGESADFLWANFTKSKEMNDKASAAFEAEVEEEMRPLFEEFAICGENPDVYHGWTLYDRDDKDFMPTFPQE